MAECGQACCSQEGCGKKNQIPRCPICGYEGQPVSPHTLRNLLKTGLVEQIVEEDYQLCQNSECQVVYFHRELGQIFGRDALTVKVWWKDPGLDVPLCYCKGVTRGQILEAWEKGVRTFAEIVKATGAMGGRRCEYENPAGRCCSLAIQVYLQELDENINFG